MHRRENRSWRDGKGAWKNASETSIVMFETVYLRGIEEDSNV